MPDRYIEGVSRYAPGVGGQSVPAGRDDPRERTQVRHRRRDGALLQHSGLHACAAALLPGLGGPRGDHLHGARHQAGSTPLSLINHPSLREHVDKSTR
jgi:hypothetical protein